MLALAAFALASIRTPGAQADDSRPPIGFTDQSWPAELAAEAKFQSGISPKDQLEWMRQLTLRPHHLGSPYDAKNSEYLLGLYKSWGWDAKIETYEAIFPKPKTLLLEVGDWKSNQNEPIVKGDSGSEYPDEELPIFNAYCKDGDVTAPIVYVNFGSQEDYKVLDKEGISVKGKIVLSRYGGVFRGMKPKIAAEHGAVGCIIFTDPKDDGYYNGDEYPAGAWRSPESAQRGSVLDMTAYAGDPLSQGFASKPGLKRPGLEAAKNLAPIPTLPITYGDAVHLLALLDGHTVPDAWRGALPLTYKYGPSKQKVHLKVGFDWITVPIHDVVAKLKGSEEPDEWVVRGNHYDAWVTGANDPISGQVALLNEAKAIGELAKTGWKPKRTLVYCSWDGEEEGLFGSTEWAEDNADQLSAHAVAYVNTDSNGRGYPGGDGSACLEPFVQSVLGDVQDPETHLTALARWKEMQAVNGQPADKFPLGAMGSGSDYPAFIQHLGVPSLDLGYGGEGRGTQYHSAYDSFEWYTKFGDPGLVYGGVLSATTGRIMMRLADSDELPFRFAPVADAAQSYLDELDSSMDAQRKARDLQNERLESGVLKATQDPIDPGVLPKKKPPIPFLEFAALRNALADLKRAAVRFDAAPKKDEKWNNTALVAYRQLLGPGLPGRPWYRDILEAPGKYTGYGAKSLPGVREAIEAEDWSGAEAQAKIAAQAIENMAQFLEKGR